jgi:hypothetical protein
MVNQLSLQRIYYSDSQTFMLPLAQTKSFSIAALYALPQVVHSRRAVPTAGQSLQQCPDPSLKV